MRPGSLPLSELIVLDIVVPPALATAWVAHGRRVGECRTTFWGQQADPATTTNRILGDPHHDFSNGSRLHDICVAHMKASHI